jgi:Mg-chelatase subunit ChlD
VFFPSSPYTDEGLTVLIDSAYADAAGGLNARFSVLDEARGVNVFDLASHNLFVSHGVERIQDFTLSKDTSAGSGNVDVVFVLDVTGSMGDEIGEVRDNIVQFAEAFATQGLSYRLGMVTFLDAIENVYDFTTDVQTFRGYVALQSAHAGGDGPENSLDALVRATQMDFRPNARKVFIWITDAEYHTQDAVSQRTAAEVVNALLLHDVVVHSVGTPTYQTAWYRPIYEPTGGQYYDINGNFQDALLDIAQMRFSKDYLLRIAPASAPPAEGKLILAVHYAGLGGSDTVDLSAGAPKKLGVAAACLRGGSRVTSLERGLLVHIGGNGAADVTLELYTAKGQRVLRRQFESVSGTLRTAPPDHACLSRGVYVWSIAVHNRESGTTQHLTSHMSIAR